MSQLTSQPNQPDRSDSTALNQTTTSDAQPPWRVEGARGPQETTRWRPPPMTTGIIDVVRAFEIRELGRQLRPRSR